MDNKTIKRLIALGMVVTMAATGVVVAMMIRHFSEVRDQTLAYDAAQRAQRMAELALKRQAAREAAAIKKYTIGGTLTDTVGVAMEGVVVSDGYTCVATDSAGRYTLRRNPEARFIYYTVPAYCEVPTHSATDRTANFFQPISEGKKEYNFTLTRRPGGKEERYKMIVIGDPQVTNAINPYYEGQNDNLVEKSDVARFTDETMADIRQTIAETPEDVPVYAISMGDDVQYYGGYNETLELQIRRVLGSAQMTVFSVIGNHDQDGKQIYKEKWEENWGPTDYSFDRGDVHYVCFNNCDFYHGSLYYSPGELSDSQMEWLMQDLQLVDSSKKVILCYHIPLTFGNHPNKLATPLGIASEPGHYASSRLGRLLTMLDRFEGGFELFCGHTHFAINHEIDYGDHHVEEHAHAAACGTIWQSNINICGTPNGYYVYEFDGVALTNSYYKPTRWDANRQMTLFRADTNFNHQSYAADWKLPRGEGIVVANVFNADSRWLVEAIEDGESHPMTRISHTGQDAFATGYHDKYAQATNHWFVSKQNGYLIMNHLYYYKPRSPHAEIEVRATDPYGHVYTTSTQDVVTNPFYNFAHSYYNLQPQPLP